MHEMPYVQNVWDKYKNDSGVQFMIINSGAKNTIDDARNWGGNKTYSFPIFFNTDATIGDKLKFNVIPATYIIDKTGKIRYRFFNRVFINNSIMKLVKNTKLPFFSYCTKIKDRSVFFHT